MVTRLSLQIASLTACIILTCRSQNTTSLHIRPMQSKGSGYCERFQVPCDSRCVPFSYICDHQNDCQDRVDERSCPNKARVLWDMFAEKSRSRVIDSLSWLRQQRKPLVGWRKDTSRVLVTLYLSDPAFVNNGTITNEAAIRDLQFELLRRTQREEDLSMYEAALYSHGFLASCLNPSNFYGENLVERMQTGLNSTSSVIPFVALALCNGDGQVPYTTVIKLISILTRPVSPDLIGQQAFALMALNCIHNKHKSFLDAIIDDLGEKFPFNSFGAIHNSAIALLISSQQPDGNFGDVYTTAIVLQALLSSQKYEFALNNITSAFNYILSEKFGSPLDGLTDAYSLLPLLSGKSLLDLGRVNCSLSPFKEPPPDISVREQRIWYSIWVGDDRSIQRDMSLSFQNESTFYDVMVRAAKINTNYSFEYIQLTEGKYVTVLMGLRNAPEEGKHWYLFRMYEIEGTIYIYPEHVTPQPNDKFVYWYRSTEVDGPAKHRSPPKVPALGNTS